MNKLTFITASNPRETENGIMLDVVFEEIGEVEFHAIPSDIEGYGRELFEKASNGDFGVVAPLQIDEVEAMQALQKAISASIQNRLDAFAQTRLYDGVVSACTYATSINPKFSAEGQYCVESRDAHWEKAYDLLSEVLSGRHAPYTVEEVLAEMPPLAWPENIPEI